MSGERIIFCSKERLRPNEIPSIAVEGKTLPEAWETAVLVAWEFGAQIPTEYDQEGDPESRDASMMITVTSPLEEPRIHKSLPCGLDELYFYTQQVVAGISDLLVRKEGWSYSYHDRLVNWPGIGSWEKTGQIEISGINQIDFLVKKLAKTPHSRRAQAITWVPWIDAEHHEPPCLQRIWCRVVRTEEEIYLLEMNTHWRSRDALKAAFMNMYALTEWQRILAKQISQAAGRQVLPGRYVDISDSFHLYGSYVRKGEMDAFLEAIEKRDFTARTYRSDNPVVLSEFAYGQQRAEEQKKEIFCF